MSEQSVEIPRRRVEIFSAGCRTCQRTIEQVRAEIDPRHDVVVHDLHGDQAAAATADALGIRTVPAVVVDGHLLSCCRNTGPTLRELHAAGLGRPGELRLEQS